MKKITPHLFFYFIITAMSVTSLAQTNPSPKATLNHIALYVVDLKISTAFYQHIIGLDTIPEPFHDGKHAWFSIGVKSHLHVIQGAVAPVTHPKQSHLCFTVGSVDTFTTVLQKNKISYENLAGEAGAITTRVDGVKQIYFKDPDGYWIEINDARE
ncbi:MAG: VOC family protein [Ferruginibacter sp.]|nr:VOC family protein [Chitinophagaceae bacterium]